MPKNRKKAETKTDKSELKGMARRLANLKRDAGPGRPLGQKNYSTIYREALINLAKANKTTPDTIEVDLVLTGITWARKGHYSFYKDIFDRIYGSAVQRSENLHDIRSLQPEEEKRIDDAIDQVLKPHGRDTKGTQGRKA